MFGAEFSEFLLFLRQFGLALVGASSLWGFVFTRWTRHRPVEKDCLVYDWIGMKLLLPLFGGALIVLLSWFFFTSLIPAYAHEGIALTPGQELIRGRSEAATPYLIAWGAILLVGMAWKIARPGFFSKHMEWFYGANLISAFFFMIFFVYQGEVSKEQVFYIGHSIHSIFTLGTVLMLDFLFLISQTSSILKQHIYPLFSVLSKVILIGLGIDFLSVALIFQEAIQLTPKFFFMQTVVGILVINGMLLAGPISRRMMHSIRQNGKQMPHSWERIADISGAISISSWGTITFVDFFHNLTLRYIEFVALYFILVCSLFVLHAFWQRFRGQVFLPQEYRHEVKDILVNPS